MKMKKHMKGQGTLYRRKGSPVWYAQWVVKGETYSRSTKTTKRQEAEKRLAEFVAPFASRSKEESIKALQARLEGASRHQFSFEEAWTEFSEGRHLASERDETLQKGRWRKLYDSLSRLHAYTSPTP